MNESTRKKHEFRHQTKPATQTTTSSLIKRKRSNLSSFSTFKPIENTIFDDEVILKNHDQLFPFISENNQLESKLNHMLNNTHHHSLSQQFNKHNAQNKVLIVDDKIHALLAKSYKSNDCSTANSDAGSIFTKDMEPEIKK